MILFSFPLLRESKACWNHSTLNVPFVLIALLYNPLLTLYTAHIMAQKKSSRISWSDLVALLSWLHQSTFPLLLAHHVQQLCILHKGMKARPFVSGLSLQTQARVQPKYYLIFHTCWAIKPNHQNKTWHVSATVVFYWESEKKKATKPCFKPYQNISREEHECM